MRVRSCGHAFVHLRAVVGNRFSSPPIWVKEPNSRHQASKSLYPLSYRPTPEHPDSLSVGVFTVVGYSVHLPLPPPVLSSVSSPAALCVVQFSFTVIRHLRELKGVRTYSAHGARGFRPLKTGSTALGLVARPKDQCGELWKASPSVACSQGWGEKGPGIRDSKERSWWPSSGSTSR